MLTVDVDIESDEPVNTFGGEMENFNAYGIQIGDFTLGGLSSIVAKEIVVKLANHLMVNGHQFELVASGHQDCKFELKSK